MMNDMIVPEEIYFMTPAVHPIALEIYNKKSDNISKNSCLYMKYRNLIYQPAVRNDSNANTKNILHHVGHTAAETGYAIKPADNAKAFSPFHDLFDDEKEKEERNSDV